MPSYMPSWRKNDPNETSQGENDAKQNGYSSSSSKLFPNWTKVFLRTTHDWRIKIKRFSKKHSSEYF